MKLTIAICTWNRAKLLDQTLTQLAQMQVPADVSWDLLVVDNNSTDQTQAVLNKHQSLLPLKGVFAAQQGKSRALNLACEQLDSDWVLWTDDDILLPTDWLRRYASAIRANPAASFFGGGITPRFEAPLPKWLASSWEQFSAVYGDLASPMEPVAIKWEQLPWGANFVVRTDVQKSYAFDPDLGRLGRSRIGGEEENVCQRMLSDGLTGIMLPDTAVEHVIQKEAMTRRFVCSHFIGHGRTTRRQALEVTTLRDDVKLAGELFSTVVSLLVQAVIRRSTAVDYQHTDALVLTGQVTEMLAERKTRARRWFEALAMRKPWRRQPAQTGDAKDSSGYTALHRTVRQRHCQSAAELLRTGADWRLSDAQGRLPLSLDFTDRETLHGIRQHYGRIPDVNQSAPVQELAPEIRDKVRELQQHGIVKLSNWVSPVELSELQTAMGRFVSNLEQAVERGEGYFEHYDQEQHWWPDDRAFVTNNIFKWSPTLVAWCGQERLTSLVNSYYGRRAHITRGNAMRYLPCEPRANDMFGWHHDMEERRLKVMISLTEVTSADQCMSYIDGSHQLFHPYSMFRNNNCSLDYCRSHLGELNVLRTTGVAGDVFVFDSNGAHRGERKLDGRIRDAIFMEYSPQTADIWGGDVDLSAMSVTTLGAECSSQKVASGCAAREELPDLDAEFVPS